MAFVTDSNLKVYSSELKKYFAAKTDLKTKLSEFENDGNFVTDASYVHTDANFTQAEKDKLAAIEAKAQVNAIESVSVNGVAVTPDATTKDVALTVAEGATDGTIAVQGKDVAVHGLGSAAYTETTAYDAAGSAKAVEDKVTGDAETDTADSLTLNGLKKSIAALDSKVGSDVPTQIQTAIEGLDSTIATSEASVLTGITIEDGKISGKTEKKLGTAADVDTAAAVAAGDKNVPTGDAVNTAINNAVSALGTVLDYKGTVATFADLPTDTAKAGDVYNVDAANGNIPAGTNYAYVAADGDTAAHWDALGGTVDLSGYWTKAEMVAMTDDEARAAFTEAIAAA